MRLYIQGDQKKSEPINFFITSISVFFLSPYIYIYISPTKYARVGICLPVILDRTLLSAYEYTPTRPSRRKREVLFIFLIRRDWEGNDLCCFSLATFSLKFNSILNFSGVCCVVLPTWLTFYWSNACRNNSFSQVVWESKYDVSKTRNLKGHQENHRRNHPMHFCVCDYYRFLHCWIFFTLVGFRKQIYLFFFLIPTVLRLDIAYWKLLHFIILIVKLSICLYLDSKFIMCSPLSLSLTFFSLSLFQYIYICIYLQRVIKHRRMNVSYVWRLWLP